MVEEKVGVGEDVVGEEESVGEDLVGKKWVSERMW